MSTMAKVDNEPLACHTDRDTRVLSVRKTRSCISRHPAVASDADLDELWRSIKETHPDEANHLHQAATALQHSNIPVAFPTETVYGLGADATRSDAVRGIYAAKQRPSDNPLIVHVCSREGLQRLLGGPSSGSGDDETQILSIYEPLIARFWPGPLTIILPTPTPSPLAKEVTSQLQTFGARMPSSLLARLLIYITGKPLAAPSANASTKPSPTTADHVLADMRGRIDIILDGAACGVGVESTVVDGLSSPPTILRPGGVGIEEIRKIQGWEDVRVAYKDRAQEGGKGKAEEDAAPRAPGMKYKHYSPKAKVTLFECGHDGGAANFHDVQARVLQDGGASVGLVRTRSWPRALGLPVVGEASREDVPEQKLAPSSQEETDAITVTQLPVAPSVSTPGSKEMTIHEVALGSSTDAIARGLFSALRALDERGVSVVYVEGIPDTGGDLADAVMNRLRKAAEEDVPKH